MDDFSNGSLGLPLCTMEFKNYVKTIEIVNINCSGLKYTWNQKPQRVDGILKKLDRVMVNDALLSLFVNSNLIFHPYRISYHSPAVLKLLNDLKQDPKNFKFANFVVFKPDFERIVSEKWKAVVEGHALFQVVKKLKNLKSL